MSSGLLAFRLVCLRLHRAASVVQHKIAHQELPVACIIYLPKFTLLVRGGALHILCHEQRYLVMAGTAEIRGHVYVCADGQQIW